MCTEKEFFSVWTVHGDWHLYEGEEDYDYYSVSGEMKHIVDDSDYRQLDYDNPDVHHYVRIDTYKDDKLINTRYEEISKINKI